MSNDSSSNQYVLKVSGQQLAIIHKALHYLQASCPPIGFDMSDLKAVTEEHAELEILEALSKAKNNTISIEPDSRTISIVINDWTA